MATYALKVPVCPGMAYAVQKTLGFGEDHAWAQRAKIVASYNGTLTFTETNTVTWPNAFYRLTLPSYLF